MSPASSPGPSPEWLHVSSTRHPLKASHLLDAFIQSSFLVSSDTTNTVRVCGCVHLRVGLCVYVCVCVLSVVVMIDVVQCESY